MKLQLRLFSLLLSIVFFASTLGFAEEAQADFSEATYKHLEMLQAFRLSDSDQIDLSKAVTRAEFANIAANMLGLQNGTIDKTGKSTFVDISNSPFAGQIQMLADLGIVKGINTYQFKPDSHLEYQQAVAILVSVLGYQPLAEVSGGYPLGYLSIANSLGILPEKIQTKEALIWADVVTLVARCADVEILMISSMGESVKYDKYKNRTYLSQYHDIFKIQGRIQDNGITALTGSSNIAKNSVQIGDLVIDAGTTNAQRYLGREIVAY